MLTATMKLEDSFEARAFETDCTVKLERVGCVVADPTGGEYVLVSIDGGPKVPQPLEKLLAEYLPNYREMRKSSALSQLGFEMLRRHINSDAHADLSYVEMAAR